VNSLKLFHMPQRFTLGTPSRKVAQAAKTQLPVVPQGLPDRQLFTADGPAKPSHWGILREELHRHPTQP